MRRLISIDIGRPYRLINMQLILTKTLCLSLLLLATLKVSAKTDLAFLQQGMAYADAKKMLVDNGWKPIKNDKIDQSSIYAQDIYIQGYEEVANCISMELDACTFRFYQNNQVLEIKTITRKLNLESFKTYKKH